MVRRTPLVGLAVLVTAAAGALVVTGFSQAAQSRPDPVAAADAFAASNAAALRVSPDDTLFRAAANSGGNGLTYVAYERTHRGLPVVGGDAVVVTSADGAVLNTYTAQDKAISVNTTAAVTAAAAEATAKAQLANVEQAGAARLVVLAWGTPRLAWEVKVAGATTDATPSALTVYVDAATGAVADSVDMVRAGTGNTYYNGTVTINTSGSGSSWSMQDPARPGIRCGGQNGSTFTGTDDVWGNGSGTNLETACADALYAVQKEWDMLGAWLGRSGINGSGGGFPIRVGLNQANAFWNGSYTSFGRSSDGQRQAVPIDVVAHEFGHGIFQNTPGGVGSGRENGGLNEATGDIFGALTEAYANNPNDPADFLVGEEVNLAGSGPIRNMYNPSALGDPNCWSSSIPSTEVHAAAGPLNHWFYLVSQGTNPAGGPTSPTCNGSSVTGIGIQAAGRIYYNAMLAKTSTWVYANVRRASLNATVNLYGANSQQCVTVKAAWNAVSVPVQSGEPTCGTPTTPPTTTPPTSPPPSGTVYSDTFETATGWTTNAAGTDTVTTGAWERGDPEATSLGSAMQLGTTVSGTNCLVTGRLAGSSATANDVDGGTTSVLSPVITLPASGTLTLSFSWSLGHLSSSSADSLRVSVVSGSTSTVVFSQAGASGTRAAAWATATANLSAYAGQTIRLRIEATDASSASLVEAGVDDVRIARS